MSAPSHANDKPGGQIAKPRSIEINVQRLGRFHKAGQSDHRVGKLYWRGGLVLNSPDGAFGGYSGLEISADGRTLLAVSDAGTWLSARIRYQGDRLDGIENGVVGPLRAMNKAALRRGRDRDAEGLRLVDGSLERGRALIAFERNHRIGLVRLRDGQPLEPSSYLRPPMRPPGNKSLESVAVLRDGTYRGAVVAFAERFTDQRGHHRGWMWVNGAGIPKPIALTDEEGFDVTDAIGLPDGSLIVLERRFRWLEGVKMRLRRIDRSALRPGAVLSGTTLLRADMRYEIDNMEGLALHRDKAGKLVLTLISDNNFNTFLQRTLLMQFELPGE